MSNKINVFEIFKGNYKTLYDVSNNRYSYADITAFYVIPFAVAVLSGYNKYLFSDALIGHLINASALLSGLLLNLMILVFGLKGKISSAKLGESDYQKKMLKVRIMKELYFNVSSASLVAFFLLFFCIINTLLNKSAYADYNLLVINPVIAFLGIHLLVSFLMITKRTYRLLLSLQL